VYQYVDIFEWTLSAAFICLAWRSLSLCHYQSGKKYAGTFLKI